MALPYTRVNIKGSLPGGEVWSVNPAFGPITPTTLPTPAQFQDWADDIAADIGTLAGANLLGLLSTAASIDAVTVQVFGEDGRLSRAFDGALANPVNGQGGLRCPPTTALAMSLYCAPTGRSYRGRLFWPALGLLLGTTTGRADVGECAIFASDMASMLTGIEDRAPSGWAPHLMVWSRTLEVGTYVTSVRCGDVPDSQRGRKDALAESRAIAVYPTP